MYCTKTELEPGEKKKLNQFIQTVSINDLSHKELKKLALIYNVTWYRDKSIPYLIKSIRRQHAGTFPNIYVRAYRFLFDNYDIPDERIEKTEAEKYKERGEDLEYEFYQQYEDYLESLNCEIESETVEAWNDVGTVDETEMNMIYSDDIQISYNFYAGHFSLWVHDDFAYQAELKDHSDVYRTINAIDQLIKSDRIEEMNWQEIESKIN
ncbi:hypothetical protein [Fodinibius salsisoli]|uniref:Uncharacterized protein n=1 Tax=Fodinibius salsisoli TaxID=2820877 RepID=A0ABT3PIP9_9BACT|nr:hypothetical protein [Fodinibius salsisoli]MCW9705814.1 hypothetical protein [Fodinibius salsisoli]